MFVETIFFISSATKFLHGGFVAVLMALMILFVMVVWQQSRLIQNKVSESVDLSDYVDQLVELSHDESIPLYQTNAVF